jgi:hypothetical protein
VGMAASPPITIVAWLGIDTVQAVMHAATTAIVATVMILCTLPSVRNLVNIEKPTEKKRTPIGEQYPTEAVLGVMADPVRRPYMKVDSNKLTDG